MAKLKMVHLNQGPGDGARATVTGQQRWMVADRLERWLIADLRRTVQNGKKIEKKGKKKLIIMLQSCSIPCEVSQ